MNLTKFALENRAVSYFTVALLLVGGLFSFLQLGQLEDPDFTVKTAVVVTSYPGASPEEVELEVTDRIERAIQELPALDKLYSESRAGLSLITVDIKQEYWADRLPQVWDELRKNVRDAQSELPPGAGTPNVLDDFSFVYGFVLAVTGDGFTQSELKDYVDAIEKDLSLVPGVARAERWGVPDKVVYVDVNQSRASQLALTPLSIVRTLEQQNLVVDAGSMEVGSLRARLEAGGSFSSVDQIGDLMIRGSALEALATAAMASGELTTSAADLPSLQQVGAQAGSLIRIRDVATVREGTITPPRWLMRFNGEPAIAISLANLAGGNIVDTGRAIDRRLAEVMAGMPIGIEVHKIAWQSDLVTEAINGFMVNLLMAIAIVLLVLTVPMGWRMGVVIGFSLLLTILGTFIVMALFGIDLQRMSLGALVIALGMMVDNAIVVSDGIYVRLKRGMEGTQAALESTRGAAWPLLGATVVAVMAFYPIFASQADAGEYCRTLFSVVAISLGLSWLIAMTITPLQCLDLLRADSDEGDEEPAFLRMFRSFLTAMLRRRVLFIGGLAGLLVVAVVGFGSVNQMFFPDAARAQLMVDYWSPAGTRIQQVSQETRILEQRILESPYVENVTTFVGQGPPRFYLPVNPEASNASYAQLIVNFRTFEDVAPFIAEIEPWINGNVPDAMVRLRKYGVGPSETWKFEARIHGPAEASLAELRRLGGIGMDILRDNPLARDRRTDMRERVPKILLGYDQARGRWTSISRDELGQATRRSFDGLPVGLYRERIDLYPIIVRHSEEERALAAAQLESLQVAGTLSVESLPLSEVAPKVEILWEDPVIARHNRRRTVSVQAAPIDGLTYPRLKASVAEAFEAIELPPGYEIFWDGEEDSTKKAQASLIPGIVPAAVLILFIIVMLFNAFRPPIIILAAIPFVAIGITAGLLATGAPFGFVALLGAMSLAGMMIKNSIVLLDEINVQLAAGCAPYDAVVEAAVSRLRPVALAAATTVLGVIPLLTDPFWVSMAVVIMAGLAFGTVLTMVLVPVLYAVLYRVDSPDAA